MMLKVENLDVFYGDAQALDGVSLEIEEGAIVAIVGANGAGKTSLIRTIAGMHRPARGHVFFRGLDIAGWSSHKICDLGVGQAVLLLAHPCLEPGLLGVGERHHVPLPDGLLQGR